MKAFTGTIGECEALHATINKALGYPRKGVQVGGGIHVPMPDTWDGKGDCPPGWTSEAVQVLDGDADAIVPLPDDVAAELAKPEARAKLSTAERTAVTQAVAARAEKELADYVAKAAEPRVARLTR